MWKYIAMVFALAGCQEAPPPAYVLTVVSYTRGAVTMQEFTTRDACAFAQGFINGATTLAPPTVTECLPK